ncbi:hypothetical protein HYV81_01115 [Candidatus Woesearchaeota archaeon]|nr:hypothetical protein [Candidatus Woesearchaeota archaeon]
MTQPTLEYANSLSLRVTEAVAAMDRAVRDRGSRSWEAYQSSCGTEGRVTFDGHSNMGDVVTAIRDEAGRMCRALLEGLETYSRAYEERKKLPEYGAFGDVFAKAHEQVARFNTEMAAREDNFRLAELRAQRG